MKNELKQTLVSIAKKAVNPEHFIEYLFYHNLFPQLTKEDKLEMLEEIK